MFPFLALLCFLLALFGVSHATFYSGLKTGRYPQPDGYDCRFPYWNTATIRAFLDAGETCDQLVLPFSATTVTDPVEPRS